MAYIEYGEYERVMREAHFRASLSQRLQALGLTLVSLSLGRKNLTTPVWVVTVNHPTFGVQALSAEYPIGTDPASQASLDDLVARISRWLTLRLAG